METSPKKLTTRDSDAFSARVFEFVGFKRLWFQAAKQQMQTPPSDTYFGVLQANQRRFFHPQNT